MPDFLRRDDGDRRRSIASVLQMAGGTVDLDLRQVSEIERGKILI